MSSLAGSEMSSLAGSEDVYVMKKGKLTLSIATATLSQNQLLPTLNPANVIQDTLMIKIHSISSSNYNNENWYRMIAEAELKGDLEQMNKNNETTVKIVTKTTVKSMDDMMTISSATDEKRAFEMGKLTYIFPLIRVQELEECPWRRLRVIIKFEVYPQNNSHP